MLIKKGMVADLKFGSVEVDGAFSEQCKLLLIQYCGRSIYVCLSVMGEA